MPPDFAEVFLLDGPPLRIHEDIGSSQTFREVSLVLQGGAYISISRGEKFFPGETIYLVTRARGMGGQVRGKIALVGLIAMGVEFQS